MPATISYQLCALTIATLFYLWRDVLHRQIRDNRVLRERVTYMLWTAANR